MALAHRYILFDKIRFSIRSNALWNVIMVYKAFSEILESRVARLFIDRKENPYPEHEFISVRKIIFPIHDKINLMFDKLPQGDWLLHPGNNDKLRAQCSSQLLEN